MNCHSYWYSKTPIERVRVRNATILKVFRIRDRGVQRDVSNLALDNGVSQCANSTYGYVHDIILGKSK